MNCYRNLTTKDFEVGQTLVRNSCGYQGNTEPRPCKVLKVGRKWVYISFDMEEQGWRDPDRFDPSDVRHNGIGFILDGGNYRSPGSVYLDMKHPLEEQEQASLYSKIRDEFSSFQPTISLETLRKIAKELQI